MAFKTVEVVDQGRVRPEWNEVFEVVAHFDAVLASGHLACHEALAVFRQARTHGVQRFLVNHPFMPFQQWDDELIDEFVGLGAHLELGIVPDVLTKPRSSIELVSVYPQSLLVFGSDTGHADFATLEQSFDGWSETLEALTGRSAMEAILGEQGSNLLL